LKHLLRATAAISSYRWALGFRVAFTTLVFIFTAALAVLLITTLYLLLEDGTRAQTILSGVATLVSGAATGFLVKRMTEAMAAERKTLHRVNSFCPAEVSAKLSGVTP
jgi:hypothetical protein